MLMYVILDLLRVQGNVSSGEAFELPIETSEEKLSCAV